MLNYHNGRMIRQSRRFALEEELLRLWQHFDALAFFNRVMDLFFKLLIFFVVVVLGMGLVRLFWETWRIMAVSELKDAFSFTVTNLLTFFIILELFKSLVEYFREHRLRLTFIVDATLVFILREVMISLYQHQSPPLLITALGVPGACTRHVADSSDRLFPNGTKYGRASRREQAACAAFRGEDSRTFGNGEPFRLLNNTETNDDARTFYRTGSPIS